jgi:hypothetical protein
MNIIQAILRFFEIPVILRSLKVVLTNLGALLPIAVLIALPSTLLRDVTTDWFLDFLTHWMPAHGVILDPQQGPILAITLADMVVMPWACVVGAFGAAALIHVYLQADAKQPLSLGATIEFAVAKWKRLILPYTLMTLIIWVGSIVIIPGILYALFFAFVAPVAVLDDDVKHVLRRSTKLTRGRRGRIFRVYLGYVWWWGWYATVGALLLAPLHWAARHGLAVANELVGFAVGMALLQLYLERMDQLRELLAARAADQAPPAVPAGVEGATDPS